MIKNNNPGNIRPNPNFVWKGTHPSVPAKNGFVNFVSLRYGVRAMVKNILAHIKQGNNTVEKLIGGSKKHAGWAPAADNNDVNAYLRSIEQHAGIPASFKLTMEDLETVGLLAVAITRHETGSAKSAEAVREVLSG